MEELFSLHPETLFLRREALEFGYNDLDLRGARHAGVICWVRQGTYISAGVWSAADEIERFRLRGRGVLLTHGNRVMLSHTSAAVELGLSLFKPDLRLVQVTRLDDQRGRIQSGVRHHAGQWTPEDVFLKDEVLLVAPVEAAMGAACLHNVEQGLVVLDSLLHHELADLDEIYRSFRRRGHHPFSRRLQIVVRLVREGAESPLETRFRYFMFLHHLPEPLLQWKVYDENGILVARLDFAWPDRKAWGEVDGKVKYTRSMKPGEDIVKVVAREKAREDLVRELTGFRPIRYVNSDLYVPEKTVARTLRTLGLRGLG